MRVFLFIALFAISGCAGSGSLVSTYPIPEGDGEGAGCTSFSGTVSGMFTNTTGKIDTCKCLRFPSSEASVIEVEMGPNCQMQKIRISRDGGDE